MFAITTNLEMGKYSVLFIRRLPFASMFSIPILCPPFSLLTVHKSTMSEFICAAWRQPSKTPMGAWSSSLPKCRQGWCSYLPVGYNWIIVFWGFGILRIWIVSTNPISFYLTTFTLCSTHECVPFYKRRAILHCRERIIVETIHFQTAFPRSGSGIKQRMQGWNQRNLENPLRNEIPLKSRDTSGETGTMMMHTVQRAKTVFHSLHQWASHQCRWLHK